MTDVILTPDQTKNRQRWSWVARPSVLTGIALMALVGLSEVLIFPLILKTRDESEGYSFILSFHFVTTLLFFVGWLLVGAGLRPRGSLRRGVGIAMLLYIAVGLVTFLLSAKAFTDPLAFLGLVVYVPSTMLFYPITWPDHAFAALRFLLLDLGILPGGPF
ncbi:hypothetical protein HYT02_01010 [Candidatus Gottesmanbacteria bacterium]|nr:hypothetical protein [Candidatus Gottesmanbacteria bacterium]